MTTSPPKVTSNRASRHLSKGCALLLLALPAACASSSSLTSTYADKHSEAEDRGQYDEAEKFARLMLDACNDDTGSPSGGLTPAERCRVYALQRLSGTLLRAGKPAQAHVAAQELHALDLKRTGPDAAYETAGRVPTLIATSLAVGEPGRAKSLADRYVKVAPSLGQSWNVGEQPKLPQHSVGSFYVGFREAERDSESVQKLMAVNTLLEKVSSAKPDTTRCRQFSIGNPAHDECRAEVYRDSAQMYEQAERAVEQMGLADYKPAFTYHKAYYAERARSSDAGAARSYEAAERRREHDEDLEVMRTIVDGLVQGLSGARR